MKFVLPLIVALLLSCSDPTSSPNYYPTYTKNLEDKIQTLELQYIAWACECANWATLSDINKYQDTGILSDHSFFIEPADTSLNLPDTLGYSADIVRFTGQFYQEKGYPKNYEKSEQQVQKARVFRYTKYKVIRSNYREFITDSIK